MTNSRRRSRSCGFAARRCSAAGTSPAVSLRVGAALLQRQTSMGFAAAGSNFNDAEKMREKVLEEAKRVFKPEFLNRISDIVFFRPLDKNDLIKIVEIEVQTHNGPWRVNI